MDSGEYLVHPPGEGVFPLVEPADVLALAGVLPVQFPELHVPAHGHPVTDVVVKQGEPFLVLPGVQQLRLGEEELLDFVLEDETGEALIGVGHVQWTPAEMSVIRVVGFPPARE